MNDMMRFSGGPLDGFLYPAPEWPPPEEIDAATVRLAAYHSQRTMPKDGYYKRVSFSPLPDEIRDKPNIFRGAQYEWVPA